MVSKVVRSTPSVPTFEAHARLQNPRPSSSISNRIYRSQNSPGDWRSGAADTLRNHLRKAAHLDPAAIGLLRETELPDGAEALAARIKAMPLIVTGLENIERTISTAGGVSWSGLDQASMIKARPGIFVADERLDWEAPTGGYLLQASFATATIGANGLLAWIAARELRR